MQGLKGWLNDSKYLLFLQKTPLRFPEHTLASPQLITPVPGNCMISWGLCRYCMYMVHINNLFKATHGLWPLWWSHIRDLVHDIFTLRFIAWGLRDALVWRTVAALPEDPSSVPSTHMTTQWLTSICNYSSRRSEPPSSLWRHQGIHMVYGHTHGVQTYMQRKHSRMLKLIQKRKDSLL